MPKRPPPKSPVPVDDFFRVPVALLKVMTWLVNSALRPRDRLALLALHAHAARQPSQLLEREPASGSLMPTVTMNIRLVNLLELLGYRRADGDFKSSAWARGRRAVARLATYACRVGFTVSTSKSQRGGFVAKSFKRPLVEVLESVGSPLRLLLHAYSPPEDRYFVLVPTRLLSLRPVLSDNSIRLAFWLLLKHRGSRKSGKLEHKWIVKVTAEELAENSLIDIDKIRHAAELARWRAAFEVLKANHVLGIFGDEWPFQVCLSRTFFHDNDEEA